MNKKGRYIKIINDLILCLYLYYNWGSVVVCCFYVIFSEIVLV